MNGNTGGKRGLRRAAALAVVAAVAVLATACGMVNASVSGGSASTGSATFRANLAYAHCMQTHGAPNFPTPANSSERFHISGRPNGKVTGPRARANDACQHLLPPGSVTIRSDG
ncbi:MAG: hypothetical protein ABR926_03955 [Streptosporangiaceae bacterium]|jgi:hypothetical protein